MTDLRGIEYLRAKLSKRRYRVNVRYQYYDMKNRTLDFQISTPPQLQWYQGCLGWCGKAVDSMADRINLKEFRNDNFGIQEIFDMNNPDILMDSAITSALISSCCFVYISPDENGYPRLQVIDGGNATGVLDPITGLLKEGYAVLERDDNDNPTIEAYFEPNKTTYYEHGKKRIVSHNVEYPLLVPVIYRPDAKRWFGHSRISRACMNIQDAAIRTLKRSEVSAEFYSFPQKWVTGLAEDAEIEKWSAAMSSMIAFTQDEDCGHPIVGQFSQQSMSPHFEQLRMLASLFGGETGLTLDDLGFASGNPSSSDAIKAAHENLRQASRKAQRNFGSGFLNVGMLAASLRDDFAYDRSAFYQTKVIWEPVFEPDGAALSTIGDGAIKINQAIPDFFDAETLSDLTGIQTNG